MQKKTNPFVIFFIFLFFCLFFFGLSKTNFFVSFQSFLEKLIAPFSSSAYSVFNRFSNDFTNNEIKKLKEENNKLQKQLVEKQLLEKENNALRDQFKTVYPENNLLLLAKIVGSPNFIPGKTVAENFILDKGSKNKVRLGQAVIFQDNLIGKIVKVSPCLSSVMLVSHQSFSIAAKTLETGAIGIIKGQGNGEIILDNVLLSENLKISDLVLTRGDLDINGLGILPNLIIGKIDSIEKKPSALFQTASVKSLFDFTKLETVFIVVENE